MLEELSVLENPGSRDGILYFLKTISQYDKLYIDDIHILCSHMPNIYRINTDAMIDYCNIFNLIIISDSININSELLSILNDDNKLNYYLIDKTIDTLFKYNILNSSMFTFDPIKELYIFHNEQFNLTYSTIRNILVDQGLFYLSRTPINTKFYISNEYEELISEYCIKYRRKFSLKQLNQKLKLDAEVGEKAEKFVLSYEQKRLGAPLSSKVKIISDIDVCAGYDILSFNNHDDEAYNRFIEVKAISSNIEFYWSSNEYEIAKLKDISYYLYLIDLSKIESQEYEPMIISNPAKLIMESNDWLIETDTYHIHKI